MSHVAFILPTLDRLGGAERQVMLLACGLGARGWTVSVVTLCGNGGGSAARLRAANIKFFNLEMRKGLSDPRGWYRFHNWLREHRPDVVHAHLPHAILLSRWSRIAAPGFVLVDTIHTSAVGPLARRIGYRASDWLADSVTGVSPDVFDACVLARTVSPAHFEIIPNGVDTSYWSTTPGVRERARQRLRVGSDFLWFSAGRLDPVKDYPTLLRAMIEVPRTARLVIAGSGPDESRLRQMATALGVASRVRFQGFETDVLSWMQAADAFVLSSRWEGLPLCLLEAGSCRLPAVATDVPGSRSVLIHGITGFLAGPGNPQSLGEAMTRVMLQTTDERTHMGYLARQHIVKNFSLDTVLDRWETHFNQLLARPAERPLAAAQ